MKHEDYIKKKIGRHHGFKTPDGFLEPAYRRVMDNLPEREPVMMPRRSLWKRVSPYVYLAAMFMGLWATMKIVTALNVKNNPSVSLDNPPALVAQAISTPEVEEELNLAMDANDIAIMSDAVMAYDNMEDFEQDFNYEFKEDVQDIDIEALQSEAAADVSSTDNSLDVNFEIDDDLLYDYYAML